MKKVLQRLSFIILSICLCGCQPKKDAATSDGDQTVTYVSEKVDLGIPKEAGYQRYLSPEGSVFGVDEKGSLWGISDFPEGIALNNATDLLISQETIFVVDYDRMDVIQVYDEKGISKGQINCNGDMVSCIADGTYVLRMTGESGGHPVINRIDTKRLALGEEMGNLPRDCKGIVKYGCDDKTIYIYTSESLSSYSVADGTSRELFRWSDLGIMGGSVDKVWKSDKDFYASSWDSDEKGIAYYRIKEVAQGEKPQRKELVITSMRADGYLQQLVTDFNNSQTEYLLKIDELIKDGEEEDAETAMTRLQASLLTDHAPDMICLQNMYNWEEMATQGYLIDLRPFLEKSERLSEKSFYPEVLEYGSSEGVLYFIPQFFELQTLAVPEVLWEKERGWTYLELVDYLREQDEYRPFGDYVFTSAWLLSQNMEYFYDEEKGEVYFDSPDFRALLEYVKECKDREAQGNVEERKNVIKYFDFSGLTEVNPMNQWLMIGYPTREGKPKSSIYGFAEVAILHSCKDADGAWRFIESYLSAYPGEFAAARLWSNVDVMEKIIDDELALYGKNEVEIRDSEGNVIGKDYTEHRINQNGVDAFRQILSDYQKKPKSVNDVRKIVYEEIPAYYEGQKSLDDVIDVIQNRVNLMLTESK